MNQATNHPALLVELLTEELPPHALTRLADSFAQGIRTRLATRQLLASEDATADIYATPRRLAVHLPGVRAQADSREIQIKGPSVAVGLDAEGQPTKALIKWAEKQGAEVSALTRGHDGKQDVFYWSSTQPGAVLADVIGEIIVETLAQLPIPKFMTYQLADGLTTVSFVRPAHRLVVLHGNAVLPCTVLGLAADRITDGHRFLSSGPITLENADSYARQLREQGHVEPEYQARRVMIANELAHASQQNGGILAVNDEEQQQVTALLDEVAALVEWPAVYTGQFDPAFLAVPQECLILSMRTNQRYFPLFETNGKLKNQFLIVSNMRIDDPSGIIDGNERVVRPRLADARFFFEQDLKKTLESRVPGLAKVVYHNKLGTQGERSERVRQIAHAIVNQLRQAQYPYTPEDKSAFDALDSKVQQAARLAKCDLLTDMVGEFPELQGVMGGYYARHEGLRDGVAIAIEDHYKPRFAGDALPRNHTGCVLALADKLETLVGLFGIGSLPTGDRDPFALRRHALGVLRILGEKRLPLELPALIAAAVPAFGSLIQDPAQPLLAFFGDRLAVSLREQGYSAQEVDAVLALPLGRLGDVAARLAAVRAFAALPEAAALAAANKRIGNILKKAEAEGPVDAHVNDALLQEDAEKALYAAMQATAPAASAQFEAGDYTASLQTLAALRAPVDAFFDDVMVNAEQPDLRLNRLGLLKMLHQAMNRVADLARLAA